MEGEIRIPGQPNTDMTQTNEILYAILSMMEERRAKVEEVREDVMQISYPADGSHATLGIGVTDLDFDAGTITISTGVVSTMSTSLRKMGKMWMESASMKANQDVIIQFDTHDKIAVDIDERYQATNQEFNRLRITCTVATDFAAVFSSAR